MILWDWTYVCQVTHHCSNSFHHTYIAAKRKWDGENIKPVTSSTEKSFLFLERRDGIEEEQNNKDTSGSY